MAQHLFSQVPHADIQRSSFDRSHGFKTAFDSGYLVPFYVDEALPGDTFSLNASLFARLSTPVVPVMDNIRLTTFFFAVPLRLVWDNFQKFMGEQVNPGDSTDFLCPQVTAPSGGWPVESLSDYLGIPTQVPDLSVNAFWHRAYNLIWNEWFRDQNLQDSVDVPKGDGPDDPSTYTLLRRGKRHDYFTSCLPWPQKGAGVEINLAGTAPVTFGQTYDASAGTYVDSAFTGADAYGKRSATQAYSQIGYAVDGAIPTNLPTYQEGDYTKLLVNLSETSVVTINALRSAFAIQRFLERDARGGTRYTEILRAHFGVTSPDARLQRPEYLGGTSGYVTISQIPQTSATDSTTPQGNMAAYGIFGDDNHGFQKSFVEHCVIIGLVHVTADLTYQQGLNRMFSRRTRNDFFWPAFSHLGEQAVLNKEIYAQGSGVKVSGTDQAVDDDVFGYQERWAEYRYKPSLVTGRLRSNFAQSLDVWHLAQEFTSLPTLSSTFIEDNPPLKRLLAVQDEPEFIMDCWINLKCARPMPVYSVPGLIDHF